MISYTDLVTKNKYYIKTHDGQYYKEMTFIGYQMAHETNIVPGYHLNLNTIFRQEPIDMKRRIPYYLFYEIDYYYDQEQIRENAQQAREKMEQRSLDMILKKVVNEEFQWL